MNRAGELVPGLQRKRVRNVMEVAERSGGGRKSVHPEEHLWARRQVIRTSDLLLDCALG